MKEAPNQFAELLQMALRTVKAKTEKNISVIEDELGYAVGRANGRSFIRYLLSGNTPAKLSDTEQLALKLVRMGGLDEEGCTQFLRYGGHSDPTSLIAEWFESDGAEVATQVTYTIGEAEQAIHYDNPFVVGPPITKPYQFFGREQELRRISNRLRPGAMEHINLIGVRRSGKTSLLHYLQTIASTSDEELRPSQRQTWQTPLQQHRWVWVDFHDPRMCYPTRLFQHLLTELGIPAPEECSLLTFMDCLESDDWSQPTVFLMDEMGAGLAAEALDHSFWEGLRALITSDIARGNLSYVCASSEPLIRIAQERSKVSPLWNIFSSQELGSLTEGEAKELIACSPIAFPSDDIAWILDESRLWPYLLQILCLERLNSLQEGDIGPSWKELGLSQIENFRYLFSNTSSHKSERR